MSNNRFVKTTNGTEKYTTLDARDEGYEDRPQIPPSVSFIVQHEINQFQSASGNLTSTDRSKMNSDQGLFIFSVQDEPSSIDTSTFIESSTSPSLLSAMSLRASEVSVSISSLFTSPQDDILIRANTSISDEDRSEISQYSEGDLVIVESTGSRSRAKVDYDDNKLKGFIEKDKSEEMTDKSEGQMESSSEIGCNQDFCPSVFKAIGRNLEQQHESNPSPSKSVEYSNFYTVEEFWSNDDMTEDELDSFVQAASKILPFLDSPPQTSRKIPMPPLPPKGHASEPSNNANAPSSDGEMMSALPSKFICFLCKQPIVGAATLDCGCSICACISCVENQHDKSTLQEGAKSTNNIENNVDVERKCPVCHEKYCHMPCLPLDEAILMAMKRLDHALPSTIDRFVIKSFQARYYTRLLVWRMEVKLRHAKQDQELDQERLLLLDEYARYEEKHFERCRDNLTKKPWHRAVGTILVAAPFVLFFGVRILMRRG